MLQFILKPFENVEKRRGIYILNYFYNHGVYRGSK